MLNIYLYKLSRN